MPLPDVRITIQDGNLGLLPQNSDGVHLKIGYSSGGPQNILFGITSIQQARSLLVAGPLLEATCRALSEGASPVYVISVAASTPGTIGIVTKAGTGTSIMTVTGAPLSNYDVQVLVTKAGASLAALTAAFTFSLDGGDVFSAPIAMPVSGIYAVPGTGLTLTFAAGNFVISDSFAFSAVAPAMTLADMIAALEVGLLDPREWRFVHIVGVATPTIAAGIDVKMSEAASRYRFTWALLHARDQAVGETTIAAYIAALNGEWQTFASSQGRIQVAASPVEGVSTARPGVYRVNIGEYFAGRMARRKISEDPGRVRTGPLAGVSKLWQDEQRDPGLDDARFSTARTIIGRAGFYLTQGRMMSAQGSDFQFVQYRAVMDKACKLARDRALTYLNDSVRVDPVSGFILELDAVAIEADITGFVRAGLIDPGDASDVKITVRRDNNILSSQTIFITVALLPLAYAKFIEVTLGFVNPALVPVVPPPAVGQTADAPAKGSGKTPGAK